MPRGGADLLREIFTYFDDTFPRQAIYTRVEPGPRTAGGGVTLTARGADSEDDSLEVETVYSLEPGSPYVEIRTVLRNHGTGRLSDFEMGDAIEWGGAVAFGPGVGSQLAGSRPKLPFLLGFGEGAAYGWWSPDGDLGGPHGDSWSDPILRTVDLDPGDSVLVVRRLAVLPSAAEVAETFWRMRNVELGEIALEIRGPGKRPAGGGRFEVRSPDGTPLLAGLLGPEGTDRLFLPPGEVEIRIQHPTRGLASSGEIQVVAGRKTTVKLDLPDPAALHLSATDSTGAASPARWTFEGLGDTPAPEFGPSYSIEGAGPYLFTPAGSMTALVPPGRYRVTVTRGPGYEAWRREVSLESGEREDLAAVLTRLDIPAAWVSADLHVHAMPSFDSAVSLAPRAGSLVCEGIEWFAGSDHGRRTDYHDVLDKLELAAPLHALVSEEVTTDKLGHFGAFPVSLRPGEPGNGAIPTDGRSVDAIFEGLRGEGEETLIQVNHPRAGSNGYFDRLGYSAQDDTAQAGFRRDFDLLEILNGKENPDFEAVWADWMAFLGGEDPVTAMGNSDTHRLHGEEAGVPRNWVRLDPESTGSLEERFMEAVRTGRVVVSNGPFIDFALEGAGVGGTALASGGRVRGHLRVIAPSWVDVSRVRVFVNGREESTFMVRGRQKPVRFDEDVEILISRPSFVIVRVEGDLPMDPVVPGGISPGRKIPVLPIAVTNPIWVEMGSGGR
jgi:hypothetical protein